MPRISPVRFRLVVCAAAIAAPVFAAAQKPMKPEETEI